MRGGRREFLHACLAVLCERFEIDPPRSLRNLSDLCGYSGLRTFDSAGDFDFPTGQSLRQGSLRAQELIIGAGMMLEHPVRAF
jgi:hypothetical protein